MTGLAVRLEQILQTVADEYRLAVDEVQQRHWQQAVEARHVALLVMLRAEPGASTRQIGQALGIRHPRELIARARLDTVARAEADRIVRTVAA